MENQHNNENWDLLIDARPKWFSFHLKEIWEYRDLLILFVRRDIVSTYKQTVLGPIWFFISPILTVITFTFVFHSIAKISTDGIPAPLFYLSGTTLWNYFQNCLTGTSNTFVANAGIFGKVYFPRIISPLALVFSNLVKLGIQLIILSCFWFYYFSQGSLASSWELILTPLIILVLALIALGSGIIISSLTTKYRDFSYFIAFGISLLMYVTPVIYPASAIPSSYRFLFELNPIAPLIEAFRFGLTGAGSISSMGILFSVSFAVIQLLIGLVLFNRVERNFMDTV